MCGIAGLISNDSISLDYIESMINSIKHRGPDDNGYFATNNSFIANTRLSIIDIKSGHQPFTDDKKSIALVQNGEIYNYLELRQELLDLGYSFNTNSDTEVLLVCYIAYGEQFVQRLNGMFAIAILDKNINKLLLYRDRLGVKPLYIYSQNDILMFSSEIKSFLNHEKFDKRINYQSIHNYFIFNYIPIPDTIFENVRHILPGHYLKVDLNNTSSVEHHKYWEIENSVEDYLVTDDEYITEIDKLLLDATKIRMRSDVSVGAFLSGGLDSSLISAYMHKITKSSFQTFTIGFNEKEFDESKYAKYITDKYGLGSNIRMLEEDIVKLWSTTTWHNDQPHGDISFIPTYIVSEFASKTHKLVLTGDGGDELFAGYSKYLILDKVDVKSKEYFDSISLFKENGIINELYTDDFKNKVSLNGAFSLFSKTIRNASNKDNVNQALYFDTLQLLPGNNLVKPDKMGMANSLEARSPFLDYRFFEILMKIPGNKKVKNGETKYILKKLALRHFSQEHVYRDKQMFTVPIGEWFKTKLSSFLVETLTDKRFVSRNIFKQELILLMINDHIIGKKNLTRELRAIVNLELWFREFID